MKTIAGMGDKRTAQKGATMYATRKDSCPPWNQANKNSRNKTPRKETSQLSKKTLKRPDLTTVQLSFNKPYGYFISHCINNLGRDILYDDRQKKMYYSNPEFKEKKKRKLRNRKVLKDYMGKKK